MHQVKSLPRRLSLRANPGVGKFSYSIPTCFHVAACEVPTSDTVAVGSRELQFPHGERGNGSDSACDLHGFTLFLNFKLVAWETGKPILPYKPQKKFRK